MLVVIYKMSETSNGEDGVQQGWAMTDDGCSHQSSGVCSDGDADLSGKQYL
jgi:hypothetical protein